MWRNASTNSRSRATGASHGIENRRVMCGLTWVARPSTNRPWLARWSSHACIATLIGLRVKARMTLVPSVTRLVVVVAAAIAERGVGDDLRRPHAGEADPLGGPGGLGGADEAVVELCVEQHRAAP